MPIWNNIFVKLAVLRVIGQKKQVEQSCCVKNYVYSTQDVKSQESILAYNIVKTFVATSNCAKKGVYIAIAVIRIFARGDEIVNVASELRIKNPTTNAYQIVLPTCVFII